MTLMSHQLLTAQSGDNMINNTAHSLSTQRRPGSMPLGVARDTSGCLGWLHACLCSTASTRKQPTFERNSESRAICTAKDISLQYNYNMVLRGSELVLER